jgi:2-oxoglutarate ferredoxin oxidoreductase subunit alpha
VGHTREKLRIPGHIEVVERRKPTASPEQYRPYAALPTGLLDGMPAFGQGYNLLVDGQLHDEMGNRAGHDPEISGRLMERLCRKITDNAGQLVDVDEFGTADAETVVIAYGSVARPAVAALKMAREKGVKAGFLRLKILWPFPDEVVRNAIRKAKRVLVPEMNIGKISREVERVGKGEFEIVSLAKLGGNLHTPEEIFSAIMGEK